MKKNENKILYIVATQYDNLGDLLINKCFLMMLCKYGKVYVDTKNVPNYFKTFLLKGLANVSELNKEYKTSVKGIGMFTIPFNKSLKFTHVFKSPGPFGASVSNKEKVKSFMFYWVYYLFSKKGGKGYFVGNDYIINSKFDLDLLKKYNSLLEGIYVRSESNLKEITSYGFDRVEYIPDMCFALNSTRQNNSTRNKISVSFRDLENDEWDGKLRENIHCMLQFFSKQNKEIEFFFQVDRDRSYNKRLFDLFKAEFPSIKFRNEVINWDTINYYENVEYTISNRLHVLLLGQNFGVIPIAILNNSPKTKKIKSIYNSIQLSSLIYDNISDQDLTFLGENQQNILEKIQSVNKKQYQLIETKFDGIFC
ncbi:polysaccharide pyruvyl transferase family protein [Echinicola sp. 20G]|uniref:polysaccharide pyruvyl transferase family protein n=1 Tax=Echinicola sp. 20G TaxID=2781961 RepID=UPI00191103A9|nr:polysaccharide pyruvyl transferase family protein [Echinicola sp. 20G]